MRAFLDEFKGRQLTNEQKNNILILKTALRWVVWLEWCLWPFYIWLKWNNNNKKAKKEKLQHYKSLSKLAYLH